MTAKKMEHMSLKPLTKCYEKMGYICIDYPIETHGKTIC